MELNADETEVLGEDIRTVFSEIHRAAWNATDSVGGLSFATVERIRYILAGLERELEIIGLASKKLPASFKSAHSEIPWQRFESLQERLSRDSHEVSTQEVWEATDVDLYDLIVSVGRLLGDNRERLRFTWGAGLFPES